MSEITKEDVIGQLEWFLVANDWVEDMDCDNTDNQTKEALNWVIDYLEKNNDKKQGALEELRIIDRSMSIEGSWKGLVDYVNKRINELKKEV